MGTQKQFRNYIKTILILLFWILLWQGISFAVGNSLLLAGPTQTIKALAALIITTEFWITVCVSMLKVTAGFALAFSLAWGLGILSVKWKIAEELLAPVMMFLKAVPVAAFVVILLILLGADNLSLVISFVVVLPIIYVNFCEGMKSTDVKMVQMADTFKMSAKSRAFYIYRPAISPFMESGIKTAMGMGIKAGVAAEVIGMSDTSIGGAMYFSKIYLDTAGLFAWTAVIVFLSFLMERLMLLLWKAFMQTKPIIFYNYIEEAPTEEILLEGICKAFGEMPVLQKVNKKLVKATTYCLMAPSGSGKTTMLHIIAGLMQCDEGQLHCLPARQYVGMVFQEDRLCEQETAIKNIEITGGDVEVGEQILLSLLPKEALSKPVRELSGGMRRRVCIARALASKGSVLILDEPFAGLDEESRILSAKVIREYQNGRILIAATHEAEDAVRLSGEIWRL